MSQINIFNKLATRPLALGLTFSQNHRRTGLTFLQYILPIFNICILLIWEILYILLILLEIFQFCIRHISCPESQNDRMAVNQRLMQIFSIPEGWIRKNFLFCYSQKDGISTQQWVAKIFSIGRQTGYIILSLKHARPGIQKSFDRHFKI